MIRSRSGKVTIIDVARAAHVSVSTVSRYLNSTVPISEEKRKNIAKAIKMLNYKPSTFAKTMRSQILYSIGIIVPDLGGYYYGEIVNSMVTYASKKGYETVVSVTNKVENWEDMTFDFFMSRRLDGIIACTPDLKSVQKLIKIGVPIVAVDWRDPIGDLEVTGVTIDNEKAAFTMMKYLYSMGHRKILAITGGKKFQSSIERENGVRKFKEKADTELYIVDGNFSDLDTGYNLTKQFIKEKGKSVTAIFAFNDILAFGVISALNDLGISVPDEISVVGFDNTYISKYSVPPLTTIEQPRNELGLTAIKNLINRFEFAGSKVGYNIIVPFKFIERSSVKKLK
ncbi:LacI family DNA-binding transcriptional regulator [Athalassotoga saccharophila]|uniref:LacI family DNA-binding transcriptional regulator n=1 Tax=Athalassotoga saccharophila TaxID=1441386 RepID=UPI00137B4A7E|nr:LacI family DNA-binding transcriptional regulator [Athalassotoga saccharophila]BBJ28993.1 HTH-type transcriptional regulator DegA [Athalassotoga saccharophila]